MKNKSSILFILFWLAYTFTVNANENLEEKIQYHLERLKAYETMMEEVEPNASTEQKDFIETETPTVIKDRREQLKDQREKLKERREQLKEDWYRLNRSREKLRTNKEAERLRKALEEVKKALEKSKLNPAIKNKLQDILKEENKVTNLRAEKENQQIIDKGESAVLDDIENLSNEIKAEVQNFSKESS